jgi:hypothetical protein
MRIETIASFIPPARMDRTDTRAALRRIGDG